MAKFRVLVGKHNEGGHVDEKGNRIKGRTYRVGEVIDTADDLSRLNASGAIKFERVEEERGASRPAPTTPTTPKSPTPPTPAPVNPTTPTTPTAPVTPKNLEAMDIKALQALAEEEEIDLKGAKTKEEIIKVLRGIKR